MKNTYLTFLLLISLLLPRAVDAQEQTVWEIMQTDLNTFAVSALLAQNEDIVALLSGPGPVTVFAPSSAAIAAIPQEQIAVLLADTTGATDALVAYHVVAGETILAGQLSDGLMVPTLQGGSITIGMTDAGFTVDGINIIAADLVGSNGVVHVLEGLLTPPAVAEAQDLPLTFESDNVEYQLFGFGDVEATRIDNPDPTDNGSAKVLSINKPEGAQTWAGVAMPVASGIDLSASPLMYARVWSPRAGVPFLLKIEDTNSAPDANGNPSVIAEVFANSTVANGWETLVFDMSTHPDFNATNAYNQVVFFADMNNPGVGEIFYVDDIATEDLSVVAPVVEAQDLPLIFESDNVEYQLFGFGDVIATRIDNPDPNGNGSGKVLSIEKPAGAQTWAGVAMPVASGVDLSASSLMYVRVWSPRAGVPFLLKIEDTNSAPDANGNPSVIAEVFANTTVAMAWETLVFDMSTHPAFNAANSYNQVVVFADMNNPGVGETFYVDDISTQNISTSTLDLVVSNELKVAPNPFQNQTLVTWNNAENSTYQVTILNVTGKVMKSYNQVSGESLIVAKDDLVSGMYFLNFQDEVGNMGTLKLMIH